MVGLFSCLHMEKPGKNKNKNVRKYGEKSCIIALVYALSGKEFSWKAAIYGGCIMKKVIGVIVGIILVLAVVFFVGARGYAKKHTVVLTNANESSEQITPLKGKVNIRVKEDMSIVFIEREKADGSAAEGLATVVECKAGKKTAVQLNPGSWYMVLSDKEVTLTPADVRVQ